MEKGEDEAGVYFDSHNHLLDYEPTNEVHQILAEAERDGVRYCVPNTTRQAEYKSMLQLSSLYPFKPALHLQDKKIQIIPSFGLHPCFLYHETDNKSWKSTLEQILTINPMFGVGEIGLDYRKPTLEKNAKEVQLPIFTEQLEMSFMMNRSVTVHCVYAHGQMLKIFKEYNKLFEDYSRIKEKPKTTLTERQLLLASLYQRNPIIMHSYGGSKQITKSLVKLKYLNIFFSLSLKRAEDVCSVIPLDQLILQTDAPYQTDVKILQQMKIVPDNLDEESLKSLEKKNHVSYVRGNLCLSKYYGLDHKTFANTVFKNSLRAFRIKF